MMDNLNLVDRHNIESFQTLRALAFMGIFFSHARSFISWPALGVSIFLLCLGFY